MLVRTRFFALGFAAFPVLLMAVYGVVQLTVGDKPEIREYTDYTRDFLKS